MKKISHSRAVYEVNLNSSTSFSGTNAGVDVRKVAEHEETILPGSATKMNPKKGGDIQFKFTKFPVRKSEETKQEDANLTTGVVK
ncbi:hypothetical protein ABFA07_005479 [Porites harrisoni]